jgi:hypothetical protein
MEYSTRNFDTAPLPAKPAASPRDRWRYCAGLVPGAQPRKREFLSIRRDLGLRDGELWGEGSDEPVHRVDQPDPCHLDEVFERFTTVAEAACDVAGQRANTRCASDSGAPASAEQINEPAIRMLNQVRRARGGWLSARGHVGPYPRGGIHPWEALTMRSASTLRTARLRMHRRSQC